MAGGISNQAEIAMFGHVTDFLAFRASSSGDGVAFYLADVMLLIGLVLIIRRLPLVVPQRSN